MKKIRGLTGYIKEAAHFEIMDIVCEIKTGGDDVYGNKFCQTIGMAKTEEKKPYLFVGSIATENIKVTAINFGNMVDINDIAKLLQQLSHRLFYVQNETLKLYRGFNIDVTYIDGKRLWECEVRKNGKLKGKKNKVKSKSEAYQQAIIFIDFYTKGLFSE